MPNEETRIRVQPVRGTHIDDMTKRFGNMKTGNRSSSKKTISKGQRRRKKTRNKGKSRSISENARESQEMDVETPFFLAPSSIPSPPKRDAVDALTDAMGRTKINTGGYRNKSRRHKSRRHKTRRHKTRRHKSRR